VKTELLPSSTVESTRAPGPCFPSPQGPLSGFTPKQDHPLLSHANDIQGIFLVYACFEHSNFFKVNDLKTPTVIHSRTAGVGLFKRVLSRPDPRRPCSRRFKSKRRGGNRLTGSLGSQAQRSRPQGPSPGHSCFGNLYNSPHRIGQTQARVDAAGKEKDAPPPKAKQPES